MIKIILLTLPAILFCFISCLASPHKQSRVGVSLPLSGEAATYGVDIKNALEFANEELYQGKFKFIYEDDRCSGKEASSIAQKFASVDKVAHVLGFGCSSTILSAAPIYQRSKITAISASAASPAISDAGAYIFRTWPSDVGSAKLLFKYISERHKKIGIISEETDFAQGTLKAFTQQNQPAKLEIYNENYLPANTDFRAILLKLRAKGIEGLFINPQSERGLINIFRQVKQIDWDIPIYGNYYPSSGVFLEVFADQADGIVFADLPLLGESLGEGGRQLHAKFLARYGPPKSGDFLFVTTLASLQAVAGLIESGQDAEDYLKTTKFDGPVGKFSFDKNGDVLGITQVLKVIQNGKPQILTLSIREPVN